VFRDGAGGVRTLTLAPQPVSFGPRRRVARMQDGVWLIGFDDFEPGAAQWLFGALSAVPEDAPVVVDLRQNLGGRISEVERALGCFLEPGSLIARMRLRNGVGRASAVRADCPRPVAGPVAVLIGRRSRSGAEMFAAAVQEWRRGTLVGGRTAGALLASLRYTLPDGGRLTLSEADFVTGAGRRVDHVGVTPDVAAQTAQADRRAGRDPELAAAVRLLTRQRASEPLSARAPETQP
jgi:carboxyl-terminal processing protease